MASLQYEFTISVLDRPKKEKQKNRNSEDIYLYILKAVSA